MRNEVLSLWLRSPDAVPALPRGPLHRVPQAAVDHSCRRENRERATAALCSAPVRERWWRRPSSRATKYRYLPGAGSTAAAMAASPGLAMGPGGSPPRTEVVLGRAGVRG